MKISKINYYVKRKNYSADHSFRFESNNFSPDRNPNMDMHCEILIKFRDHNY